MALDICFFLFFYTFHISGRFRHDMENQRAQQYIIECTELDQNDTVSLSNFWNFPILFCFSVHFLDEQNLQSDRLPGGKWIIFLLTLLRCWGAGISTSDQYHPLIQH